MVNSAAQSGIHPVGIDLGTTYSSLAYLTPQGEPVTLPNAEGELSTPSVVLFDGNEVIVGTEALRHSVTSPERVVQYAKRHMGDPHKCWVIDGKVHRPKEISAYILRKLLRDAQEPLGKIRHAVITVPAQFSELQRRDTVDAGLAAGLERVDIIHEPVASSLCYVLGEGMWFAELANEQTVLVFDLGGGTFDLSIVKYNQKEVRVLASGGDLLLGGMDWNLALQSYVCDEFAKTSSSDPRLDRESLQALALEIEQAKRSLSVRSKSNVIVQHGGRRRTIAIGRDQFESLTNELVQKTERITRDLLKSRKLGWAHINTILATGGSSRMPMIRNMLQRIGGTTLNQSLSPDQSISHGAAYYAGMLLSGRRLEKTVLNAQATDRLAGFKQQSVSGRSLGILVRDPQTEERRPHYLIPANTPLPCAYRQRFGTVIPDQRKVHLHLVESGATESDPCVELGECVIEGLPENLPVTSPIEVTIRYDEQARVHLEAVVISSGQSATTTLIRPAIAAPTATPAQPAASSPAPSPAQAPAPTDAASTRPVHAVPAAARASAKDQFALLPGASPSPAMTDQAPQRRTSLSNPVRAEPPGETPTSVAPAPASSQIVEPDQASPVQVIPPGGAGAPVSLDDSERPVPLCNTCGEVLNVKGFCSRCQKSGLTPLRKPVSPPPVPLTQKPVKTGEDAALTEALPINAKSFQPPKKPIPPASAPRNSGVKKP